MSVEKLERPKLMPHHLTYAGKLLGRCVGLETDATPWRIIMELEPGVSQEEVESMAMFADLKVEFV